MNLRGADMGFYRWLVCTGPNSRIPDLAQGKGHTLKYGALVGGVQ